ncbi:hypothetical protein MD484_g6776, partial [Candolleomyces efflorescens]
MTEFDLGSSFFHDARNTTIHSTNFDSAMHMYPHNGRLQTVKHLQNHIAAGALHNSAERCDAPRCHPETRVAVQGELVDWIKHGEQGENPKKIVWVTGPAGGGKTAIMSSLAETCQNEGLFAGGFFFSTFAQSVNRRYKRCLVPTLAYQLVQHKALQNVRERILICVEKDPAIFRKRLEEQFSQLLTQPLQGTMRETHLPKVILIDGLDECQAEEYGDTPRSRDEAIRANEADQTEILDAILKATNNPSFPFRFIIASRPEPAILSFFTDTAHNITKTIFLDNEYNPDADILLFVDAKFNAIRRQYHLPASWPSQDVKHTLVTNASGQFIYVATAMRFLEGSSGPPEKLLDQIMALGHGDVSVNPFAGLDALYTHILNSTPNPLLAARFLCSIFLFSPLNGKSAWFTQVFLEFPSSEASYVFRGLNSLIPIPLTQDHTQDHTSPYPLFHKPLTDFFKDKSRCGMLYVDDPDELYYTRYLQIWKDKGPAMPLSQRDMGSFLHQFFELGHLPDSRRFEENFQLYDVAWWLHISAVTSLFKEVHVQPP